MVQKKLVFINNESLMIRYMGKRTKFLQNWGKIIGRNVSYKRPHYQLNRLTINHSSIDMAGHILLIKDNNRIAEIRIQIENFDVNMLNRHLTVALLLMIMLMWILYYSLDCKEGHMKKIK